MPVQVVLAGRPLAASAFLFDKDGTLFSFDHWLAVMRERARRLAAELALTEGEHRDLLRFFGLRPEGGRADDWGIIPLPRVDAEEETARWLSTRGNGALPALRDLVARAFRSVDEDFPFERYLQPTPGAGEALAALRAAGARIGIVTHDTGDAAWRHLRSLGW
ncbi:MAG: HAD family hydrolase, partial [Candidatus Bipolaricaulota bacterium]|nr:HAD family hydrolase [Candidatus Bipolaricaulota bacterium]